jgi:hypothetical protein
MVRAEPGLFKREGVSIGATGVCQLLLDFCILPSR